MNQTAESIALRGARKSLGLSVAKASERLGISPATLKRWEKSHAFKSLRDFDRLLDGLGVCKDSCWRPSAPIRTEVEGAGKPVLRLLRSKRVRHGLTLQDLSALTGLCVATLHRYETGARCPDDVSLTKLSKYVGCTDEEIRLLKQSLSSKALQNSMSLVSRFLHPDTSSHFWVFEQLGTAVADIHSNNEDIPTIMQCFLIMGDARSLCETWPLIRQVAGSAQMNKEQRALTSSLLALARSQVSSQQVSQQSLKRLHSEVESSPFGAARTTSMLHLSRIETSIGNYDCAEQMLRRAERDAEALSSDPDLFVCDLHRKLIAFERSPSESSENAFQAVCDRSDGPLQRYTAYVALLSSFQRSGNRSRAAEIYAEMDGLQIRYGYGSPMAQKIAVQMALN